MANVYPAGVVTAYGAAVEGGYTGTYQEFCEQQANYAETGAAVERAKEEAEESARSASASETAAENSKDIATAKASEASSSADSAAASASASEASANTATAKATSASNSATTAENAKTTAQSYAIGGTGSRQNENQDNAKYYAELARQKAEDSGFAWFHVDDDTGELMVTVSESLSETAEFEINQSTGELEVIFNG